MKNKTSLVTSLVGLTPRMNPGAFGLSSVTAISDRDAAEKADEEAGNHEFSENTAIYQVEGMTHA